jgi:hypothetical protein
MYRTTKKGAGNNLDGRRHLEHPFDEQISKSEIIVPLDAAERRELDDCEVTIRKDLDRVH